MPKEKNQINTLEKKLIKEILGKFYLLQKEEEIFLNEGEYHNGKTKVMRMNAIKVI